MTSFYVKQESDLAPLPFFARYAYENGYSNVLVGDTPATTRSLSYPYRCFIELPGWFDITDETLPMDYAAGAEHFRRLGYHGWQPTTLNVAEFQRELVIDVFPSTGECRVLVCAHAIPFCSPKNWTGIKPRRERDEWWHQRLDFRKEA